MDHRLFITLELKDDCKLVPVDHTVYDHWADDNANHGVIEFLTTINDEMVKQKFTVINAKGRDYSSLNHCTALDLVDDGVYVYHKLIIPSLSHFAVDDSGNRVVVSDATKFAVANKYFVYNGDIYYSKEDSPANVDISKFKIVQDIREVWDGRKEINEMFWYDEIVVSICHITKCLYNLQRKTLIDSAKDCDFNKCSSSTNLDTIRRHRDFILDAVMVLKFLIRKKLYTEVQEILEHLTSCGNTICKDFSDKSLIKGGCGCG